MVIVSNVESVVASFTSALSSKALRGIRDVPSTIKGDQNSVRHFPLIIKTCTMSNSYVAIFLTRSWRINRSKRSEVRGQRSEKNAHYLPVFYKR